MVMPRPCKPHSPFRYFNSSPEVIRLVVMMYVRFPLSLRNVEDLLFERGIDICHETVRHWWNRCCQSKCTGVFQFGYAPISGIRYAASFRFCPSYVPPDLARKSGSQCSNEPHSGLRVPSGALMPVRVGARAAELRLLEDDIHIFDATRLA